jgi:hypothetical protein
MDQSYLPVPTSLPNLLKDGFRQMHGHDEIHALHHLDARKANFLIRIAQFLFESHCRRDCPIAKQHTFNRNDMIPPDKSPANSGWFLNMRDANSNTLSRMAIFLSFRLQGLV